MADTNRNALVAARALIERPENWCQGAEIDRRNGHVCYCPAYALYRVGGGRAEMDAVAPDLMSWNDKPGRTHAEVLDAFDNAINRAS